MLLIQDAECVATMDDAGTEWRQASVLIDVNGQVVADHGQLVHVDQGVLVERHNRMARQLTVA